MHSRMAAVVLLAATFACKGHQGPPAPFDPTCEKILSPAEIEATCGVTLYGEPERRGPGMCSTAHRQKAHIRRVAVDVRVLWETWGSVDDVRKNLGERRKKEPQVSGFAEVPGVGDRSIRYIFTTGGTDITHVSTTVDRWILDFSAHGNAGQDNALCNAAELIELAKIAEKNLRAL